MYRDVGSSAHMFFSLFLKYIQSYMVKIMVFRRLCKAEAKTTFQILSVRYISTSCVCVFIFLNTLSFLLIEGQDVGAFSFVLNIQI